MRREVALRLLTDGMPVPPGGWSERMTLAEAGLDSVAVVDRLFRIEEQLGLRIAAVSGDTLADLLAAIDAAPPA